MKWYNEEETKALRQTFETAIHDWPKVTTKTMFGCPCYLANGKMFAGLVTRGIVLPKLTPQEKAALERIHPTQPFRASGQTIKSWVQLSLTPAELRKIMPFVKASYEHALKEST